MYTVKVRDHVKVAHSLKNKAFGVYQNLHGATYIIDAEFQAESLDEHNVVIDISLASQLLNQVLVPINHQNLDEFEIFDGKLTTIEYLSYFIHQELAKALAGNFTGNLKITLGESHVAWASFEEKV